MSNESKKTLLWVVLLVLLCIGIGPAAGFLVWLIALTITKLVTL